MLVLVVAMLLTNPWAEKWMSLCRIAVVKRDAERRDVNFQFSGRVSIAVV